MTSEENKKTNTKKWIAIGCGGCLTAMILFVVVIVLFILLLFNSLVKEVSPTLDRFFEYYNAEDTEYICTELLPEEVSYKECTDTLNYYYDSYGKEVSYDFSFFKSYIKVYTNNDKSEHEILTPVIFEKVPNGVIEIITDTNKKNNNFKITTLKFSKK